jgi:hypothetical protein
MASLQGEELRHHEDLVTRYGPAREVVATHVPAAEVLARLPLIRVFSLCFPLPMAHRCLLYQTSYDEVIGVWFYHFCLHFWVSMQLI